jgi:hypothetical protein
MSLEVVTLKLFVIHIHPSLSAEFPGKLLSLKTRWICSNVKGKAKVERDEDLRNLKNVSCCLKHA